MRLNNTLLLLPVATAIGAGLAYTFDAQRGRSRRARLRDRAAGAWHRGARKGHRALRFLRAQGVGLARRAWYESLKRGRHHPEVVDDVTLVHRIESDIYRRLDVPKGALNISAEGGRVILRGALRRPDQIREIESAVARIPGVRRVESLLHLEGTPAPNKADAIAASHVAGF